MLHRPTQEDLQEGKLGQKNLENIKGPLWQGGAENEAECEEWAAGLKIRKLENKYAKKYKIKL